MADLFKAMYSAFDLEDITVDDLVDIVFTCLLYKRICELEKREGKSKSCRMCVNGLQTTIQRGVEQNEDRCMIYTDRAIRDIPKDGLWSVIQDTCCVLGLPKPSD